MSSVFHNIVQYHDAQADAKPNYGTSKFEI